jgi:dihydroflavonol-4-reductase
MGLVSTGVSIAEAIGHLPLVKPLPLEHFKTLGEWRALSTEKARRELGFDPRPISDTIRDALAWFRQYDYL